MVLIHKGRVEVKVDGQLPLLWTVHFHPTQKNRQSNRQEHFERIRSDVFKLKLEVGFHKKRPEIPGRTLDP